MDSNPELEIEPQPRKCQGCIEDQPNQLAHYGGCMPDLFAGETWDDL